MKCIVPYTTVRRIDVKVKYGQIKNPCACGDSEVTQRTYFAVSKVNNKNNAMQMVDSIQQGLHLLTDWAPLDVRQNKDTSECHIVLSVTASHNINHREKRSVAMLDGYICPEVNSRAPNTH